MQNAFLKQIYWQVCYIEWYFVEHFGTYYFKMSTSCGFFSFFFYEKMGCTKILCCIKGVPRGSDK